MIRRVLAQTKVEILLTLRRGESLLLTVGIPVGIVVFFSAVDVLPHGGRDPVTFLVPGTLALSVIATAMTALSIATGFERQAGVLKRLGVTPLGRDGLLAAKVLMVLAVEAMQLVAVAAAGFALGWRPAGGWAAALALLAVGTAAFAGIGFALAGRLRAEANLAATNGLFLVLLMLGGVIVPVSRLPGPLRAVTRLLPAAPMVTGVRRALEGLAVPASSWIVLGAWAVAACIVAAATFRWE